MHFLITYDQLVILKKPARKNIDSVQSSAIFKIPCQTHKNAPWFPGTPPLWPHSYGCKWPRDVSYMVLGYKIMILLGKKGGDRFGDIGILGKNSTFGYTVHCTNNGFLVPKKNSEVVSEGEDIFLCVSHDCFRRWACQWGEPQANRTGKQTS